jgi:hypothetical protein
VSASDHGCSRSLRTSGWTGIAAAVEESRTSSSTTPRRITQVGAILGITEGAAKLRAFRAYAELRKRLGDLGTEDG